MSFTSLRRVLRTARKGLCATCSKTRYPQLEAAGAGHVGCLIYTLETIGGIIRDEHDVTAMHVAARKGQISVLIYLIENKVVNSNEIFRARNGATPAHDAAGTGNLDCLRYLLTCTQASPNDLDINSATPLHWAAQSGQIKVVQWLAMDARAPIDVVAKNGVTPFHLAAAKNHLEVVSWMVGFAFRTHHQPMKLVNAKDKNGSTPLYHAAHAGNINVIKWLAEKGGGDPTVGNHQGLAPLHAAAINGYFDCVKFLFRFGLGTAPGGMRTSEGACVLHFAAAEGHIEILQWLLKQKECSGNERDYYQSTPLHDAAENGHLLVIKLLCESGADPTLSDIEGNRPIDLARKNGHSKCVFHLDNFIKGLLKSRINGSVNPEQPGSKLHRSKHNTAQIMDKFRNAPPHMMPVNAFDEDAYDELREQSEQNAITEDDNEQEWVTIHDLMEKDEIEQLGSIQNSPKRVARKTEADMKRKLFEEKLAKEQEERQKKRVMAIRRKQEQEEEIRHQFFEEGNDDIDDTLRSFDSVLEEQRQLVSQLQDQKRYLGQVKRTARQLEEKYDEKRGSKWISKLLRKRATSPGDLPESKFHNPPSKPRRPNADPYHSDWSIPTPPPLPKMDYLLGKSKVIKPQLSQKEDQKLHISSSWGREAYDDHEDDDGDLLLGSESKVMKNSKLSKPNGKDHTKTQVSNTSLNGLEEKAKVQSQFSVTEEDQPKPSPRRKKKLTEQRKLTPIPSMMAMQIPKSDLPTPKTLTFSETKTEIEPDAHTAQSIKSTIVTSSQPEKLNGQARPKLMRQAPVAPVKTGLQSAPIAKLASARTKGVIQPLTQSSKLKLQEKHILHANFQDSPPESPTLKEIENDIEAMTMKIRLSDSGSTNAPVLNRQYGKTEQEDNDEDNSLTSSSDEDSSDYASTESSDDEDDDDDRPIMARNMGIHGAKIARQVMQRMKNQRYPSIFRKPIVRLDTILDIRYETPHQANTNEEKADLLRRLMLEKLIITAWKKDVQLIRLARHQAEQMMLRRRRAVLAEIFYAWIQAKNESEVNLAEGNAYAQKFYRLSLKNKIFKAWKAGALTGKRGKSILPVNNVNYLQWLNDQLKCLGKPQVDNLQKSLEDGVLIILVLANVSGKKPPRYKHTPKLRLHYQDNWKVAYEFMRKIGIRVRDFEPADLADLQESAIHNMFTSILKWLEK